MKKLFTLLALLTCFLGANSKEIVDAEVDFSKYTDISEVPFASWRGSESAFARLSIQDGCLHFHSDEATDPSWDCQFFPIGMGNNAEPGIVYTLHYKIKGSVAQNVSMLGFGQTPYGQFPITTDWVEGTVDYEATSSDGNILMQCGDYVGDWDIAYLKITHDGKEERPVEWIEDLTNGDASKSWAEMGLADVKFNDQENNYKICAWSKERMRNMNEAGDGWDPFPADIEEVDGNRVFVCHGQPATTEGDASAWDNQFWIQSPQAWKAGSQVKIHFRYKASAPVSSTDTQIHKQNPSDYLIWHAIGNIAFTTEWQEFDGIMNIDDDMANGWSIAFNLNSVVKDAVDFYFDDLSWQHMKLDEGLFVAAANTETGIEYDFDNAKEFEYDEGEDLYIATVGTQGKKDTWVNELMISTVRGNDRAFKSSTIKPSGEIDGSEDTWLNFVDGSNYKIKLPAAGVWTISIDNEGKQINFFKVEGDKNKEPLNIQPNPTVVVINALERDDLADGSDGTINEGEGGTGQPWDNQFWIVANRTLQAGEATVVQFKYKSTIPARVSTQSHAAPGAYLHWAAIGDVNFTEEWQDFEYTFTVPSEANDMQSIAFNLSEIRDANTYEIKDFIWKLEDNTETLINQTGSENFFVKVLGEDPHVFDDGTGISSVVTTKAVPTVTYNLAGQRVSKDYKGIVVKNGKKLVNK